MYYIILNTQLFSSLYKFTLYANTFSLDQVGSSTKLIIVLLGLDGLLNENLEYSNKVVNNVKSDTLFITVNNAFVNSLSAFRYSSLISLPIMDSSVVYIKYGK